MFRRIKKYSVYPGLDLSELFLRVLVSFVTGNSDMHLKNFSLRETEPASRQFRLAEAYDLLPVQLILPEDEEQMALTLNGKKRNIRKKDFAAFAERCGILEKSAEHMIKRVCSLREKMKEQCSRSFLPSELIQKLKNLIDRRIEILS